MLFKSYSLLLAACGGVTLLALSCGSAANASVIYNDTFARTGALIGSSPSPTDTGSASWTGFFSDSAGTAQTNGSELVLASPNFSAGGSVWPDENRLIIFVPYLLRMQRRVGVVQRV